MATSKTLTPTNVTIQIPEFTDQPDQRVNSNCIDKEADAINALNNNIANIVKTVTVTNVTPTSTGAVAITIPTGYALIGGKASGNPAVCIPRNDGYLKVLSAVDLTPITSALSSVDAYCIKIS